MTAELREHFEHVAVVEQEIRREIDRYKSKRYSPRDFGPRIRTHPHLAITSKLKMQHARTAAMSFAGKTPQTLVYRHEDKVWLARNLTAARTLIATVRGRGVARSQLRGRPNQLFMDVPVADVLAFLDAYQIHPDHVEMPRQLLQGYIRAQNAHERLKTWNIAIVASGDEQRSELDLG